MLRVSGKGKIMVQGNRSLKKLARKIQSEEGWNYTEALEEAKYEIEEEVRLERNAEAAAYLETVHTGIVDGVMLKMLPNKDTSTMTPLFKGLLADWAPLLTGLKHAWFVDVPPGASGMSWQFNKDLVIGLDFGAPGECETAYLRFLPDTPSEYEGAIEWDQNSDPIRRSDAEYYLYVDEYDGEVTAHPFNEATFIEEVDAIAEATAKLWETRRS